MTIPQFTVVPSTNDPTNFADEADQCLSEWNAVIQAQNEAIAALTAIAAGTAVAIPYTFSTATADADPGSGFLRLDNATQNAATTIRADLTGADGSTWTDVLNTFDDSTSTVKGQIALVKLGDATKWLAFNVTALASPSGYKNITVANVASSAASPFANNDSIVLKFTRTGDKGDTGAAGADGADGVDGVLSGYFQSADQTITSAGALTIAHGLGATPKLFQPFLKNVTAEHGYSIGDITLALNEVADNRGAVITADSTNIYIRFGSSAAAFPILNKTTGAAALFTNANWKYFLRAWV